CSLMVARRPVLTATSAASRLYPVAKALGCGESNTPTSGIPTPAACASRATMLTSHCSVWVVAWPMTLTPMAVRAIHLDMRSDTNAPPKPNTAAKTSNACRLLPRTASQRSRPIRWAAIVRTASTARLVTRSRKMRFMALALGPEAGFSSGNSANYSAEGSTDPKGHGSGAATDQHHAQRPAQRLPAGEEAQRQADR